MTKRLTICISVLIPILFCSNANANIFPNDAETAYTSFLGNVTNQVLVNINSEISVLYLAFSNSSTDPSATITLSCGTKTLLYVKNMNTNGNFERFETRQCSDNLLLTTTSMGVAVNTSVKVIFVRYDLTKVPTNMVVLASASIPTEPLLNSIASNSLDILPVYASMTAGDLGIMLGLFALVMLTLLAMLWRKNKFS